MEAAVNSLPNEILEIIFSYCTHSDLVQSIQNVCCRWREVAQSTSVWEDVTYCPRRNTRSKQIVKMLEISPKLQNIILQDAYYDGVLEAITDNCSELRKLKICPWQRIDMNFIKNLQEKCPKVEYLNIPHPVLTHSDKCEGVAKFTNLTVLNLTTDPLTNSSILKPVADTCKKLEYLELETWKFEMYDLRYLLTMRKETLHTVGLCCSNESGECVLPALSTCELKSLSLFNYASCPRRYEKIEHFGRLKTVRALSITTFSSEDNLKQIFENENMAQLVELSLDDSPHFDNEVAEVIVKNCPLLKNLSLKRLINMTDSSLKLMTNFKELSSLTISANHRVTDTGILHLQDVKGLKYLRILWCKFDMRNIAKLSTLQAVSLEGQDLAEFPWDKIPHHMQSLQYLCFCLCWNVHKCAIEKLKMQLPHLKVLNISKCGASGFSL